jgi:hypothetical protein
VSVVAASFSLIQLDFRGKGKKLIMNDHEEPGPGVIPGRYAGEPIRLHEGPTPQAIAAEEQRRHADGLAGRISAAAADAAGLMGARWKFAHRRDP